MRGAKTAGLWPANVLWNKPTLKASIGDMNKRFKSLNVKVEINIYRVVDTLPSTIIQHIYGYANTYKVECETVVCPLLYL